VHVESISSMEGPRGNPRKKSRSKKTVHSQNSNPTGNNSNSNNVVNDIGKHEGKCVSMVDVKVSNCRFACALFSLPYELEIFRNTCGILYIHCE
jgi:hypothetical protein